MTRKRGTCVLVGLPPGEFPVPLFDVVANCTTICGSFVGTRQDMAEALLFAAEGKVKPTLSCSLYLQSTQCLIGSSVVKLHHAWSSNSRAVEIEPGAGCDPRGGAEPRARTGPIEETVAAADLAVGIKQLLDAGLGRSNEY